MANQTKRQELEERRNLIKSVNSDLKKDAEALKGMSKQERKEVAKTSIKIKLIRSNLLMTIIAMILVALVTGILFSNYCKKAMNNEISMNLDAYSSNVEKQVEIYKLGAQAVAKDSRITNTSMSLDQRREVLAQLADQYGFLDISVSDANGKTYNNTDIHDREYFIKAMAGETYISTSVSRRTDNSTVFFVSCKIDNGTDWQGIVYCALDVNRIEMLTEDIELGQTGYAFIVDKDGTMISHPTADYVEGRVNFIEAAKQISESDENYDTYQSVASVIDRMVAEDEGSVERKDGIKLNGELVVGQFKEIAGTDGWKMATVVPRGEMLQDYYKSVGWEVGCLVLFVVVAVLVTLFAIVKPIITPILSILERVKLMEQGDLHTEVEIPIVKNEIYTLSVSLQDTINTLNDYISDISYVLSSMADNDFTVGIDREYRGDFVEIKSSLQKILGALNEEFLAFEESSTQVSSGSAEVSNGAQALAQGATEQASAIQELSATIADINDKVKTTAENALKANDKGNDVGREVNVSAERMNELLSAMKDIDNASTEISKIMKTIEDIAFQTNILALNASVEAARAGEAGKGFSVVADEVRNLAGKCATASKDTAVLIENSMKLTKRGTKLADNTAESLEKVVETTQEVCSIVDNISMASQEQAKAIDQINLGVEQISAVVQTNSATAEESAAASEQLNSQATLMRDEIAKFKLQGGGYTAEIGSGASDNEPVAQIPSGRQQSFDTSSYEINPKDFEFGAGEKY